MGESLDVVVVGAGVVGLAVARQLACAGREVIAIERNPRIGEEASSRNSEVIHAGIYYPTGSLKARLCVLGKELLYRYCAERGVQHRRCGKLIIARGAEQCDKLEALRAKATANGVEDLRWLAAEEVAKLEPEVDCTAGLLSPSTGILDSHGFMSALRAELEAAGGTVVLDSEFVSGSAEADGFSLLIRDRDGESRIRSRTLVNAAGLHASRVAWALDGLGTEHVPVTRYAKGTYFLLKGSGPFRRLVYPLPEAGGLGVHVTMDLAGQTRFGPDVEWVSEVDYSLDTGRAESFREAIRSYWPGLPENSLVPGYVGVRSKVVGAGEPPGDFIIQGPDVHGIPELVNLFGIESPGLTAALAIGEYVEQVLGRP